MQVEVRCKECNTKMERRKTFDGLHIYNCLSCDKKHIGESVYIIKV